MIQTRLDSFVLCNPCPTIPETLPKPKYVRPKCPHGKRRAQCKECGGSSICEHRKRRAVCKECGGSSICEHRKRRAECKECGGSQICEHRKHRGDCTECGGSSTCEHRRRRRTCAECGGSQICEHRKQRALCKECGGSQICEHRKQRSRCKECGGSQICEHRKLRYQCSICDPISYNIYLRRVRRCHALKGVINPTHTLDDLCMTHGEWDMYLHKLFEVRYGRPKTEDDRVQIDEIIPCKGWNLPDDNKYCWHYLNSQWLIDIEGGRENQEKGTKYTEEDKRAMIERIDEWFISNPYPPPP